MEIAKREHSGSMAECLTRERGAKGSSLTGDTVLCPCARHIYPCLKLVQPRKTHPDIQGFSLASAIGHSPKIVPDVQEFAVQFGRFSEVHTVR